MLLAGMALAGLGGCSRPGPAAGIAPAPYPSLASVPPRPQLSYSVEQRQAIESELVRDREHATYMSSVLAHETGAAAGAPPPPPAPAAAPPPAKAAVPAAPRNGPGDDRLAEAYVKDQILRDEDRGKLKDFLKKLERPAVGAPQPTATPAEPAAGEATSRPDPAELERFGDYLGGPLGVGPEPAAAAPASAPAPAARAPAQVVARIDFAPSNAQLPAAAAPRLTQALDQARRTSAGLRIATGGGSRSLQADRARSIAAALMRMGASADMLELAPGAAGEEALISLRASATP